MSPWWILLVANIGVGVVMAWDGRFFPAAAEATREVGMSRGAGLVCALALYPIVVLLVFPAVVGYFGSLVVQLALAARRAPPEMRRGIWRQLKAEYSAAVNEGRFTRSRRKKVAP